MSLGRTIALIAAPTMLSRLLGFARDMAIAAMVGAGPIADAFFIAFKLPNFFRRLFAEGAFAAAFVPLFARQLHEGGREAARTFAREAQAALLTVLLPLVGLLIIAMPGVLWLLAPGLRDDPQTLALAIDFGRLVFPYLLFISLVSLYGGVLNGIGRFAAVAATPVLLNLSLLGALFALTPWLANGGYALSVGVFVAGVLQFCWLFAACAREDMTPWLVRPRWTERIARLWRLILPAAIGSGAQQINAMLEIVWASFMPAGTISFLYYADRLNQLPIGVLGAAIGTALLPTLAHALRQGDQQAAAAHQNRAMEFALLLSVPAAILLALLAEPTVALLFQRGAFGPSETARTAAALTAFAIGLPAFVLVKAVAPAFFAREDTRTPLNIALACIAVSIALNLVLLIATDLNHVGIALATSISGLLNAALLIWSLRRQGLLTIDSRLRRHLPRIGFAALAMLALLLGCERLWAPPRGALAQLLYVVALGSAGALLYGALTWAMGVVRLDEVRGLLRRRAPPTASSTADE